MDREALVTLTAQALTNMKVGNELVGQAVGGTKDATSDPALKAATEKGMALRESWHSRIVIALKAVGGPSGEEKNPIVQGLQDVARRIREQAPDSSSRDLGICADGQLSLHYWIAAFGTVRDYLAQLDLPDHAKAMEDTVQEAKQADAEHTAIAKKIIGN